MEFIMINKKMCVLTISLLLSGSLFAAQNGAGQLPQQPQQQIVCPKAPKKQVAAAARRGDIDEAYARDLQQRFSNSMLDAHYQQQEAEVAQGMNQLNLGNNNQ
jgi:hypothetical protein